MKGVFGLQGPPRLGICDLKAQGQLWPLPFGPGSPPSPEPPGCAPFLSPGLLLGVFVWPWVSQAALAFFSQVSGFTSCWEDPPIHEPVTSQEVGLPTLHHQALGIHPVARKQALRDWGVQRSLLGGVGVGALARDGAGREGHFVFSQNARGREASLWEIQKIEKRREDGRSPGWTSKSHGSWRASLSVQPRPPP